MMTSPEQSKVNKLIKMELLNHTHSLKLLSPTPIAKVFVYKQWRGFEFDSGWQRSVELPFEAIKRKKKFYLPTRRDHLRH